MSLAKVVKEEAHQLGFQLVGVTTPDIPQHFDVYTRWLDEGRHGEMSYLATERAHQRRADIRQILPDCRSILVLGLRYPAPEEPAQNASGALDRAKTTGRVAAYAWGTDYHEVFPARMSALVSFIEKHVGHPISHAEYTDTGPILERDLAQQAGLGWIGKNTCLINPQAGSYFLLGEILLGVELDPDQPFLSDRCGSCTRCLEACPTGCILPDRTLDARRCISYLTIELKGPIPTGLRAEMSEWVFGCDICQQVCPWNLRFAASQGDPELAPRPGLPWPFLVEEIVHSPESFSLKFYKSPVKRTRRSGYLRNVAVALGNQRDLSAVPVLARHLQSESEALVRLHIAWALGRIGGPAACQALVEAVEQETDASVLEEIRRALENCGQTNGG